MKKILLLLMCVFTLCGCSSKKEEQANTPDFGNWEKKYYVDEFGDETDHFYYTCVGEGTYSNSATTNGKLQIEISCIPEKKHIVFRMFEGGVHLVVNHQFTRYVFKNSSGDIYENPCKGNFTNFMSSKGEFGSDIWDYDKEQNEWFWNSMMAEGEIKLSIGFVGNKHYNGTVDVSGFKNLYESYLQAIEQNNVSN